MSDRRPAHTIQLQPWRGNSIGSRVALEAGTVLLWPLQDDDRMSVLINLLAAQIDRMLETDDEIDGVMDTLRMQLHMMRAA